MFTGIISEIGAIQRSAKTNDGLLVTFARPSSWHDVVEGESINTNGVCLTVAKLRADEYETFLMPETLERSTFGTHVPEQVNLERALKVQERLSGHFVQGHVDESGTVKQIDKSDGWRLWITIDREYNSLIVEKGSIAIDGVSLTVADVAENSFSVALVPYTLEHTTLASLEAGDKVNLEFDVIGKYVARIMEER